MSYGLMWFDVVFDITTFVEYFHFKQKPDVSIYLYFRQAVILLDICEHKTIMKDMCAECGADLRR